jgi:L,D-peptidoglycan transpeptidase YkuD (ErfK/YbiS/YcfS/YnhG family)
MITVTSPAWRSTSGTLKAWQRNPGGRWRVMHGPLQIVLGYAGWVAAAHRLQNTGTSPAGRFQLPTAFGLATDPGAWLPYRRVDGNDWWPYEPRDPATYNIYQSHRDPHSRWRSDFAEHLASYPGQYDYAVVVGFNLPKGVHYSPHRHQLVARHPADTRRGGGIFLHVRGTGATEGCIAMDRRHLPWLLRWLDPERHPQVVMGPYSYVLHL